MQVAGKYSNPYKFNAKELDSETALYYYGARYYNPRLSIWYGVDPLAVYDPVLQSQFYGDGEHNGGVYNQSNINPYIYCYQNPINLIDPNGKQTASRAHGRGYRGIGIPIPVYERGNTVTPFPVHDVEFIQEGFDKLNNDISSVFQGLIVKVSVFGIKGFDVVKDLASRVLNSDKLEPQTDYKGNKKHGIKWKAEDAISRAIKEQTPQGKWGSQEDLDYAGEKAATLEPGKKLKNGKNSPGQFHDFPINPGSTSTVYYPDGTQSKPDKLRLRNNGDGKFYGFPIDSKTAKPIK